MTDQRGFTLIEMMVAVALTGLVAVGAYQTFDQAVLASTGAQEKADQINRLDRSWRLLEQDLQHALARQNVSTNDFDQAASALYGAQVDSGHFEGDRDEGSNEPLTIDNPEGYPWFIRMTRGAWLNPLNTLRSNLRGVAYHVADGRLWRLHWPVLNNDELELDYSSLDFQREADEFAEDFQGTPSGMRQQLLLEGVQGMAIRYLPGAAKSTDASSWHRQWPSSDGGEDNKNDRASLPVAIEVSMYLEGFGESTRLFLLSAPS